MVYYSSMFIYICEWMINSHSQILNEITPAVLASFYAWWINYFWQYLCISFDLTILNGILQFNIYCISVNGRLWPIHRHTISIVYLWMGHNLPIHRYTIDFVYLWMGRLWPIHRHTLSIVYLWMGHNLPFIDIK